MEIKASAVIDLAHKYIGYTEKASNKDLYDFTANAGSGNFTMFQAELDRVQFWNGAKQGYEWCTSFVAWLFWRLCGTTEAKRILCLTGEYGAGCVSWARYYKQQNRLYYSPQVGDQYFQKGSDGQPCHTGIVIEVNGSFFKTIEGNCGNAVRTMQHSLNSGSVYGFGRPHYTQETEEEDMIRYNKLDDIPAGYQAETKELMQLGLNGRADGNLDISEDMLRCMIVNLRICKALTGATTGADAER